MVPTWMKLLLGVVFVSFTAAAPSFAPRRIPITELAEDQPEPCGATPSTYDKYRFSLCWTCWHHVAYVQGIRVAEDATESFTDIGTLSNSWLHQGHRASHYYDQAGEIVALMWSTILNTAEDTKEMVMIADCNDESIWEVEGSGYSQDLGSGVLHLDNGTRIDFTAEVWGNKETVVDEKSGEDVIKFNMGITSADASFTPKGKELLSDMAEDPRIFILLIGTAYLREATISPWAWMLMVWLPEICLCCALIGCCIVCAGGYGYAKLG